MWRKEEAVAGGGRQAQRHATPRCRHGQKLGPIVYCTSVSRKPVKRIQTLPSFGSLTVK